MTRRPITEDDLNAHVDDRLPGERRAEVDAYLGAHPEASARLAAYRTERDLLRGALAPIADEPLPPELDLVRMIERRRPAGVPRWAMAAAAVFLVALGGAGGWSLRQMQEGPRMAGAAGLETLGREAAASYAVYAPDHMRPVEIRAQDRDKLLAWISQRVGRPLAIPDLADAGYRLMGGRVVATEHGPAALFMYDDDKGTRLVVLARPMASSTPGAPMTAHAGGGINGFSWSDDGLGFSLVGAAAPETLHPLADEARRQLRGAA
ncbi:anti-sigma factor family protein [Ancylobacter pratisalsi]|uniref:Anti-sigma factor n=1 Tax=Ancylobacter pratisalsi TaxID=1745854 RepID=A0A6P1YRB0_9HYPH|nr:anti-sigma factor [Ancylobacter pratisalsi]QIB35236.1 anti-sigma factor [Ancylobacter pratisalsi]